MSWFYNHYMVTIITNTTQYTIMVMRIKKPNPKIVAVAVIEKNGDILLGKRKKGKFHAGVWEFPGGTVEDGETFEQCLVRELQEEFNVDAKVVKYLCTYDHQYTPDYTVRLSAYLARLASDGLTLNAHDEVRWVRPEDLHHYLEGSSSTAILEIISGITG